MTGANKELSGTQTEMPAQAWGEHRSYGEGIPEIMTMLESRPTAARTFRLSEAQNPHFSFFFLF